MTRMIALAVLLAVVSSDAAAEWIKVGGASSADIYVDPATIRRTGNIVEVVALYDLKTAIVSKTNGIPYASQKSQSDYNCVETKWRMLQFWWYSKNMGEGKMVEAEADTYEWAPVRPGSGAQILWQRVCGK